MARGSQSRPKYAMILLTRTPKMGPLKRRIDIGPLAVEADIGIQQAQSKVLAVIYCSPFFASQDRRSGH